MKVAKEIRFGLCVGCFKCGDCGTPYAFFSQQRMWRLQQRMWRLYAEFVPCRVMVLGEGGIAGTQVNSRSQKCRMAVERKCCARSVCRLGSRDAADAHSQSTAAALRHSAARTTQVYSQTVR